LNLEVDDIFETLHAKLTSRHQEIKDEIRSAIQIQVDQCARIHEKVSTARSNLSSIRQNLNRQLPSNFALLTSSSNLEQALEDIRVGIRDLIETQSSFQSFDINTTELPSMQKIDMYEAHKEVQLLAVNETIDAHIYHDEDQHIVHDAMLQFEMCTRGIPLY